MHCVKTPNLNVRTYMNIDVGAAAKVCGSNLAGGARHPDVEMGKWHILEVKK